ncbi:MmcB family DNA repair protein [Sphingomonas changnyeongensis]|uniref:MmcB family DNA repair protein n=1 Tax=Sphingomonas changnyeongensis TaxID=2698679 RepID=A0A7Z2NV65_9SPHN|nr:MmcB family DNA repair protein [Sphingomonas changnyeongensis]QHL90056.1 MmcB family DNA repair protein [Sphingomonas changnyeongensis]
MVDAHPERHVVADLRPAPAGAAIPAADVARGVARMLLRHDYAALTEVPLGNGRRADIMAINSRGQILIVEIKVSRADLLGDGKWPEYLDYCDRFCWAVPAGFPLDPFDAPALRPDLAGLIVADRYDAQYWREAGVQAMPPARRRAETLRFARRAAHRLIGHLDPDAAQF